MSDLEMLDDVAPRFILTLQIFSDSSILLLVILVEACTLTDPLAVLLVRVLAWSRSGSESSRLWLSSELES